MKKIVIMLVLVSFLFGNYAYGASRSCSDKNEQTTAQEVVNTRRPHRGIRYRSAAGMNGGTRSMMPMSRGYYSPYVQPVVVPQVPVVGRPVQQKSPVVNVAPQFPAQAPNVYNVVPGRTAMPYVPGGYGYTVRRY